MLAEAKVLLGEDPATEINRVRRRAFGDAYDASTVGFPNQEVDKRPTDAVLQERLFEFMLEGKRWYDLRRFGDSCLTILRRSLPVCFGLSTKELLLIIHC